MMQLSVVGLVASVGRFVGDLVGLFETSVGLFVVGLFEVPASVGLVGDWSVGAFVKGHKRSNFLRRFSDEPYLLPLQHIFTHFRI